MELLREVAAQSERALIVVTHDARIFPFADRIAHMDDGRIERVERRSSEHLRGSP
jgi:putative ABC transport system ATP-binding protein